MKLFKAIRNLVKKNSHIVGSGSFTYESTRYISKSGADLLPGPIPIPASDELQSTLFIGGGEDICIAMCIYEKILWLIPYHYNEFILKMKVYDININECTAEDIVKLMDEAVKWNKGDKFRPVDNYQGGDFVFINTSGTVTHFYSVDSGDYIVLKKQ